RIVDTGRGPPRERVRGLVRDDDHLCGGGSEPTDRSERHLRIHSKLCEHENALVVHWAFTCSIQIPSSPASGYVLDRRGLQAAGLGIDHMRLDGCEAVVVELVQVKPCADRPVGMIEGRSTCADHIELA